MVKFINLEEYKDQMAKGGQNNYYSETKRQCKYPWVREFGGD
jgi:hypothetical protein